VKLDKLARQIRRDIAASPKKAAVLGLMVLVALYFWAPMIWGWIKPSGDSAPAVAASDVILEDEPIDPQKAATKKEGRTFSWEKVRRKVAADPRMTPAMFEASWFDPFRRAEGAAAAVAARQRPQSAASAPLDPSALGLKLTSVAISPRQRSAVISGQKYREGEIVPLGKQDDASPAAIEFRLIKVGFHEVQLEYQGQTFTLELSRPRLAPGDALNRSQ
jgi:hypothetical protein